MDKENISHLNTDMVKDLMAKERKLTTCFKKSKNICNEIIFDKVFIYNCDPCSVS